jgi:transcriptional regulator with XRE-family HTH domain
MKLQDRVALRIRVIRKRPGFTQEVLAEKVERTVDAISQLERGRSLPSFETLERLALALDVPIRDFFDVGKGDDGGIQRTKLIAVILDIARGLPDKDLQMATRSSQILHRTESTMAFLTDVTKLKDDLILFRRGDVQHSKWYCRMTFASSSLKRTLCLWSRRYLGLYLHFLISSNCRIASTRISSTNLSRGGFRLLA